MVFETTYNHSKYYLFLQPSLYYFAFFFYQNGKEPAQYLPKMHKLRTFRAISLILQKFVCYDTRMKRTNHTSLIIIIIFSSGLGFLVENLFTAVQNGYIDNRGMIFPALLGYGFAIVFIYITIGTPLAPLFFARPLPIQLPKRWMQYLYYFVSVAVLISIGESILGIVVEKQCHLIWWSYETLPLHIGKYTSVPTSLGFALLIFLFMRFVFPTLYEWASSPKSPTFHVLFYLLFAILVFDFLHAVFFMLRYHNVFHFWAALLPSL